MDALSVIPAAVLRNLSDKLYEKRKNAALEVEGIVKTLAASGDHDKITAVINLLTTEYTFSPQANHRKGGLIGLAAATVGLTSEASQHLESVSCGNDSIVDNHSKVVYKPGCHLSMCAQVKGLVFR
ncbi:Protein VAC14-like [Vitis vinifera]|uniref:Protein VAC14-like n=1 Tax=Vitis vinifera TaxID=29760 RepID=A0A438JUC0_VITVI|nr:Protein VAC14-like [Vitis vinifera]